MKTFLLALTLAAAPAVAQANIVQTCESWKKTAHKIMTEYQAGGDLGTILDALGPRYSVDGSMQDLDRRLIATQLYMQASERPIGARGYDKLIAAGDFRDAAYLYCLKHPEQFFVSG